MAWTSTVPATLAALTAAFTAAPGLAGAEIRYGRQIGDGAALQVVAVGWDGSSTGTGNAVDGSLNPEGLAPSPEREQYTVHCAAAVLDGGGDLPSACAAAYQLASAAAGALAANPTLGGTVMRAAVMAATSLMLDPVPDGARAVVLFDVDVDAFTGR
jgi:hypothetical protein